MLHEYGTLESVDWVASFPARGIIYARARIRDVAPRRIPLGEVTPMVSSKICLHSFLALQVFLEVSRKVRGQNFDGSLAGSHHRTQAAVRSCLARGEDRRRSHPVSHSRDPVAPTVASQRGCRGSPFYRHLSVAKHFSLVYYSLRS